MHHMSKSNISGQSTRLGTRAFLVFLRLMVGPSSLVGKRIVFEEGYVTTLECNTHPFLTAIVALSKASFRPQGAVPWSLPHFQTSRPFQSLFISSKLQTIIASPILKITAICLLNPILKEIDALPDLPTTSVTIPQPEQHISSSMRCPEKIATSLSDIKITISLNRSLLVGILKIMALQVVLSEKMILQISRLSSLLKNQAA